MTRPNDYDRTQYWNGFGAAIEVCGRERTPEQCLDRKNMMPERSSGYWTRGWNDGHEAAFLLLIDAAPAEVPVGTQLGDTDPPGGRGIITVPRRWLSMTKGK